MKGDNIVILKEKIVANLNVVFENSPEGARSTYDEKQKCIKSSG